jgi:hypothetical protein
MRVRLSRVTDVFGAISIATCFLQACGSKVTPSPITCSQTAQVACPISAPECDLSWTDVLNDGAYCGLRSQPTAQFFVFDCGGYHVLQKTGDMPTIYYYYAADSGALTAKIELDLTGSFNCVFGPLDGFVRPTCGDPKGQTEPGWCPIDGSTDG